MDRFKFWLSLKKQGFRWDKDTGMGYAVQDYNMFRDEVLIRTSRHGYVLSITWAKRDVWEKLCNEVPVLEKTHG